MTNAGLDIRRLITQPARLLAIVMIAATSFWAVGSFLAELSAVILIDFALTVTMSVLTLMSLCGMILVDVGMHNGAILV